MPQKPKAKVFIDGSNIYFAQKKLGKWLDWVKVSRYLKKKFEVLEISYYVGLRKNDQPMRSFLKKLRKVDFKLVNKPVKKIIDETGREIEKANFDVEITGDVLESKDSFEIALLFSGDSDFEYLAKLLHQHSKKLYVFSSRKTLSWELKLSSDKYFFLEDLLELTMSKRFVKI